MRTSNHALKIILGVLCVALATTMIVWAVTMWHGEITWTLEEIKEFSVWDSASNGDPKSTTISAGALSIGIHTFDFYLQNDGNVPIIVNAIGPSSGTGFSLAVWSNSGSYTIPMGPTRVQATLTITVTDAGSYSFDFNLQS